MHIFKTTGNILKLLLLSTSFAIAQADVGQCALDCVANINGTNCARAEWNCLCADRMYIERLNNCTYAACDKADEDTTFGAIAKICQVFSYTLTYGPEATAPTSSDQIFSTQGILSESSLPPVLSPTVSASRTGSDTYTIATAPSSSATSDTGMATSTSDGTATPSSASSPASATVAIPSGGADKNSFGLAFALAAGANIFFHG